VTVPIASPVVSDAAKDAVCDVLDSGMLADGKEVRAFEREFAEYVSVDHAIATANGTTALHAMLEAAGIGDGDAVVTSPFSFIASANAVVHAGGTPAFADVRRDTFNLDPDAVRDVVEERDDAAAIMPVHLYGLPAAMDAFREIADDHDLLLFEDAAQAHGATYRGQSVGGLDEAAAFSFYPTKNMTTAEGGMVTTDDDDLAAHLRKLVNHGRTDTYEHAFVGYNYRMTNVQAAIGREQLRRLPEWVEQRRANAAALSDGLSSVEGVETPTVPDDRTHAFHQYTIRTDRRNSVTAALNERGVGYGVYYPKLIPEQPAYDRRGAYPEASTATDRVLSVPVHPSVSDDDVAIIASAVAAGAEVTR
jgi:dTDP-4-amino-4,6-dideoxygalactose transaminase